MSYAADADASGVPRDGNVAFSRKCVKKMNKVGDIWKVKLVDTSRCHYIRGQ